MAFSWHNHCLCRVGAWSRTSHARWTADVRNLTGMQQSRAVFSSVLSLVTFWQKKEQRTARTCTRSWNWSAESKVYCRAGAALHCRSRLSVCAGIFQICVVCWNKGSIVDKQVDIVKVQLAWTQSSKTDPRAVTVLFLWPSFIQNVTRSEQKLHHSACSCPRRLRVLGRSKFTKLTLTLQEKALQFFSFESATTCRLWEPWRPGPGGHIYRIFAWMFWSSCLAEVILFLKSGHAQREREREIERERRGKGGGSEIEPNLYGWHELRFQ